jgi:hypothetical protein
MKSASIGGVREGGTLQPRGSVTESDSENYCDKDKLWKSVNGLEAAREGRCRTSGGARVPSAVLVDVRWHSAEMSGSVVSGTNS